MNNYATLLSLAVFSALIFITTGLVSAQNETSSNQSMPTNSSGSYNLTATGLDNSEFDSQSGQISGRQGR